jgi:filamentous hemagglutinin family protein
MALRGPLSHYGFRQSALLATVSALAMFVAGGTVVAKPLGSGSSAPPAATTPAVAPEAGQAALRAQAAMKQATQAIQAMQAAQKAARDAARGASGIAHGLQPGGLQQATGGVWIGANNPTQALEGDRTKVNIEQTQKNAVLTWQTFNVSEKTDLRYDQKGHPDWVALNRVIDPDLAPSRILGSIKSDGTVLVINQNGIIFGAGAQINVGSLMASTLDVGPTEAPQGPGGGQAPTDMAWRNQNFLQNGLLGFTYSVGIAPARFSLFSGAPANTGEVSIDEGASITTSEGGLVLLVAPHVTNAGAISAPTGQVILAATGLGLYLTPSSGAAGDNATPPVGSFEAAADPNIRGLVAAVLPGSGAAGYYAWNKATGLIEADKGNITLISPTRNFNFPVGGASYNDGILSSTTSVSRNGSITIDGADIRLGVGSLLSILPDKGGETIPQNPASLEAFKPSAIKIGANAANIEMQSGAFLYAPGADVEFGMPAPFGTDFLNLSQKILINSGAQINVAGLTDVLVPTAQVQIVIDPAKKNELRDSPLFRDGFLNGSVIYLDPRKSGVRDDGVAWIGSPLIDAAAYYQLVGVGADRLMTEGGNVRFGSKSGVLTTYNSPAVVVREGAVIDMSGGWVRYQAGNIRETNLVTRDGRIVPIGAANPDEVYVGIAGGFTRSNARWGVTQTWANPLKKDSHYEVEFTEGRDAGVLRAAANALVLDGTLHAQAYAGTRQLANAQTGTGKPSITGDLRAVQGSNSELPAGGALLINGIADIDVAHVLPSVPSDGYDNWTRGAIADDTGNYIPPTPASVMSVPDERRDTLYLTDTLLSGSGLSQISLTTAGDVTVEADSAVALTPGGIFKAAGLGIKIDGDITAQSGRIILESGLFQSGGAADPLALGDLDIVINGNLSVAGRWVNEYGAAGDVIEAAAWLNGGSISMSAGTAMIGTVSGGVGGFAYDSVTGLPMIFGTPSALSGTVQDISGSILVASDARLNLSGGGHIDRNGGVNFSARGGNLALKSEARYYQTLSDVPSGFRLVTDLYEQFSISINPDRINARIVVDPASVQAHGFGGGGTFTLVTPEFALGDGVATTGAVLPFDFFSTAGFANYDITSYKTELTPSTFTNGYGGYNALLATQTISVGAGQTLSLVQSVLSNVLNSTQQSALRSLESGGDVNTVVLAEVPANAWDQKAVNLKLGGMIEVHVEQGGQIVGAAGSSLTVGGLLNEGRIRIAGGKITQELILPRIYSGVGSNNPPIGIRALSDIFSVNPDGTIDPAAFSTYDPAVRNEQLVGDFRTAVTGNPQDGHYVYKLGVLDQGQGIVLAQGSITDLSGAVILNPYAGISGRPISTGAIIGGGALQALSALATAASITSPYRVGGTIVARPDAVIDLSGASGAFDVPAGNKLVGGGGYMSMPVWSDGGALLAGAGGTFTGAVIRASGGSSQAQGGTLQVLNTIFTQHDPSMPAANTVSADMITRSGFDTFVATGNITSQGDVTLALDRAFFLQAKPWDGLGSPLTPVISTGGALIIDAPYIALQNASDQAALATTGTPGTGTVTLRGRQIDITGSALFDRSVSQAIFEARGDIRLIGVAPFLTTLGAANTNPTLKGMISVNGDLSMTAAQIYPTTGASFAITSTAGDGTISFGRSGAAVPATPYSAGGNLLIQAAHIVQGGVIRVPFGTLTLGSNGAYTTTANDVTTTYAPATQSVVLADGSITSVSANGLSIPYGTTTDTIEWYFAPTGTDPLSGPPIKVLSLNGGSITLAAGATVDLSGGGDVYAYEFVPGTGGSRDVLSQFNSDQYSSNDGYQYPDGRQVYAIVPGLSDAPTAAYDPLYSANYGDLSAASGVGKRVYLSGGNGLAAGWYTLLPAQYAMLPGGMRVVERSASANGAPGLSTRQKDGTIVVAGYYGDALSGTSQSQLRLFDVQSQAVIRSYSNIVLTSGNKFAADKAAGNGTITPRTGMDAGRLVLNPLTAMAVDAIMSTAAAQGGRGAQVDISGAKIDIVSTLAGAPADGAIHLTVAGLNNLHAESLLIGGIRTDNADGTTSLTVTANSILVANDAANPLVAPEIVLAVDDGLSGTVASSLVLDDGATLIATGVLSDQRGGAYIIDGRLSESVVNGATQYGSPAQSAIGAFLRVANGPQRVVQRLRTPTSPTNPGSPAGPDASLTIGNVDLRGNAIGLDTSHNADIAGGAQLHGKDIAFGAGALAFTNGSVPVGTVVITPLLQAILSQGDHLTLHSQTSIGFDDGSYSFGATTLDAATLLSLEGGTVNLNANRLQLSNAGAAGTSAGGSGTLSVVADELTIGSGTIATSGFGGVSLSARKGMFSTGNNGVFDMGSAAVNVIAPYIGDRAASGVAPKSPTGMTLRSTGMVTITNAGTTAIDIATLPGIPGSSLTVEGNGVSISGTHMRATAGSLSVKSSGNLALSNGAVLEAPGYTKTFGDAADPRKVAAPGGTLSLSALGAGGIALGDAFLSVGGGTGNGGNLKLSAANGAVDWGAAVLSGKGGTAGQGGTFSLDTNGAIDLVALNTRVVTNGFTGGFNLRTRTGDIVLGADQILKSGSVNLTADGGFVTIAGTIDTSGINGGDIELYGVDGVTLLGTAKLDSHANGYAADDTRQAKAGNVTLGTDFLSRHGTIRPDGSVAGTTDDSGTISVASGAVIDASARRPGNRLVRIMRGGAVNYAYVQGDEGGVVSFRAPVVTDGTGNSTINVQVESAGSVIGARSIELEGFKRWDLATVAGSGLYSGITYDAATDTITLDVAAGLDTANDDGSRTSAGGLNFLGDKGAGTVVTFVQGFDVSAAYADLGGLASRADFSARPGVELGHDGNITLASNWNLGAGTVDIDAAKAAGLMAVDSVTDQAYVIAGNEATLLANYTAMTYRVGGRASGAAPLVSLRAGDNLHLKGSLTDGFFQFRDQYDPTYQSYLNAKRAPGATVLTLGAWQGSHGGNYVDWQTYLDDPQGTFDPNWYYTGNTLIIESFYGGDYAPIDQLPSVTPGPLPVPKIPFSALGNSAAALAAGPNGVGDPLASAVVMPLLPGDLTASSSDYRLTAGADRRSADPLRLSAAALGNLIVDGPKPQAMTIAQAVIGTAGGFSVQVQDAYEWTGIMGPAFQPGQPGFDAYLQSIIPGLSADAAITLPYNQLPPNMAAFIDQELAADPSAHVRAWMNWDTFRGEVTISVALFSKFLAQYPDGFGSSSGGGGGASNITINLLPQTLIRTGTGGIRMGAAGNIDLTGGSTITYLTSTGTVAANPSANFGSSVTQLGGAAVYTAGHPVSSFSEVLPDPVTGALVNVFTQMPAASVFQAPPDYRYGLATAPENRGFVGIVIADTLTLGGGGDIELTAQGSVLGRRDLSLGTLLGNVGSRPQWLGSVGAPSASSLAALSNDQPWRINSVTQDATTASANPQLFRTGVGALGGGNVLIEAGGSVSDILAVADTSLITAVATPSGGAATRVLVTLGGGNVAFRAGRDILAARVDVARGTALLSAGGRIGSLPLLMGYSTFQYRDPDNVLRSVTVPALADSETQIRIDDTSVDLIAGGDITIQGIRPLDGFYSDYSALNLVANGSITITNTSVASPVISGELRVGSYAVYPGTFTLASLMGNANLRTFAAPPGIDLSDVAPAAYNMDAPTAILLMPTATGQLAILAGGDIAPTKIAMLDGDPNELPGLFTLGGKIITDVNYGADFGGDKNYQFAFPSVFSTTREGTLEKLHTAAGTHAEDAEPVYLYAGGDIGTAVSGVTLFLPKQARITSGRDIVNMMFFGQNLAANDLTRIVAGRDLIGTSILAPSTIWGSLPDGNLTIAPGLTQPVLLGNSFILGGPGDLMVEAGRNMGPFLNSAEIKNWNVDDNGRTRSANGMPLRFGQGIITIGNDWNPYLPEQGANITVLFGVGKGADYESLRDTYLSPGTVANTLGGYGAKLVAWMQRNAADKLQAEFGTTQVSEGQAYDAFRTLPDLRQRLFLINDVYFNELRAPAVADGPSYLKYSRGYTAVNTLFPASLGYTANGLEGGASDGAIVHTGDLDLRLAAVETVNGGNINILGPGGRVLAGSVVSTAEQAARRNYAGYGLYRPQQSNGGHIAPIEAIPTGYEGVISLRGGTINTFTDGDFLLNQSRLFTVTGGDITMWSSNADLNAGQGAKTTPNFPPAVVRIGKNAFAELDQAGATSGAGIAALPPGVGVKAPDVYLLAPRGTVDAGDAGVRSAGNISVAALHIANADNFKIGGVSIGLPTAEAPNIGGLTDASNQAAAADPASQTQNTANEQPSIIIVEVLGFGGGEGGAPESDEEMKRKRGAQLRQPGQNPDSRVQVVGAGALSQSGLDQLTPEERQRLVE